MMGGFIYAIRYSPDGPSGNSPTGYGLGFCPNIYAAVRRPMCLKSGCFAIGGAPRYSRNPCRENKRRQRTIKNTKAIGKRTE